MQRVLDLFFSFIENFFAFITPVYYCNQGYNLIRKTCGAPGKIYKKSGIAFKFPIIQIFDVVNMKRQVHFLNAHSIKSKNDKAIPYNITVDAQVEFRIIDPMVIYQIDLEENGREPIRIYVDNEVHLFIDEVLKQNPVDIQAEINKKLSNRENLGSLNNMIKIERIVISAFDYNLSIRHAQ